MSDTILRQMNMLQLIPRYPQKVTTANVRDALNDSGYEASLRTIQRDLQELSRVFPIISDDCCAHH